MFNKQDAAMFGWDEGQTATLPLRSAPDSQKTSPRESGAASNATAIDDDIPQTPAKKEE